MAACFEIVILSSFVSFISNPNLIFPILVFNWLQVLTLDFLNEKLGQYMAMYNDTVRGAHLDLVFFKDAMTHLVKVNTVLLLCFPTQGRPNNRYFHT